ncbi:MAG TPA: hypothetical protein VL625_11450 [Patescibacteria group bacterium]|nr:hypothetical protein [Patescibacteria group bacterium]
MKFADTVTSITEWFGWCASAMDHNPQDWVSPRELVDDFAALGLKHRGADIGSFNQEDRLKFQIVLAKHMTFFADIRLLNKKTKPRTDTVDGRLQSLPEQGYHLSALGKKLAYCDVRTQKYYVGMAYALNRIKSIFRR